MVIMRMKTMVKMKMIRKMVEFFERARLKVGHHEDENDDEDDND